MHVIVTRGSENGHFFGKRASIEEFLPNLVERWPAHLQPGRERHQVRQNSDWAHPTRISERLEIPSATVSVIGALEDLELLHRPQASRPVNTVTTNISWENHSCCDSMTRALQRLFSEPCKEFSRADVRRQLSRSLDEDRHARRAGIEIAKGAVFGLIVTGP